VATAFATAKNKSIQFMAMNFVPLDKAKHQSTKVAFDRSLAHAKKAHIAAASIKEFAQLCTTMPILFVKDPQGGFRSIAMLGVEQEQNLFLQGEKWDGPHVPMNILRYPFDVRVDGDKLGVFIDEDSELLNDSGEALFNGDEPSEFLKNRQQFLSDLTNSEIMTKNFIDKMAELELIEDIGIFVTYENGERKSVTGLHSINEKKLLKISDEKVLDLHKNGFLGAAYAVMLSVGQLSRLVELSAKSDKPIQSVQIQRPGETQQQQPA
jgi:hypothetical protein